MFVFQLWPHILKAFCCVFVQFVLEIVLPYLLDLVGTLLSDIYIFWTWSPISMSNKKNIHISPFLVKLKTYTASILIKPKSEEIIHLNLMFL